LLFDFLEKLVWAGQYPNTNVRELDLDVEMKIMKIRSGGVGVTVINDSIGSGAVI